MVGDHGMFTKHDTSGRARGVLCGPAAYLGDTARAQVEPARVLGAHVRAFTRKQSFLSTRAQETHGVYTALMRCNHVSMNIERYGWRLISWDFLYYRRDTPPRELKTTD